MTETSGTVTPRKRRRVFLWIFLAVQVIFIIWIIAGASGNARSCAGLAGQAHSNCVAGNVGTGIGVVLIFVVWCVVDFLLGVPYVIYRLARRP